MITTTSKYRYNNDNELANEVKMQIVLLYPLVHISFFLSIGSINTCFSSFIAKNNFESQIIF